MKPQLSFLIFLLCSKFAFSQKEEKLKMNDGFGFSIQWDYLDNNFAIYNKTNQKDYWTSPLNTSAINFGLYYKGFGLKYTPGFASKMEDDYSDNYSKYSGFQLFYYSKMLGIDIYRQNFEGYWVGHDALQQYRPDWELFDGYHWAQNMKTRNSSLNLYVLLLGKKRLSDYFSNPLETRKSKIGLFSLISVDSRKIFETKGLFVPESEGDFLELYNGFTYAQIKSSLGLGTSATLFLWNFFISSSLAGGYSYAFNYTEYHDKSNELINNSGFEMLQLKINFGYQGKLIKIEYGARADSDLGAIGENYEIQYTYFQQFLGFKMCFPTKSKTTVPAE